MTRWRVIFGAFALCAALSVVCALFVDRPVEMFVAAHQRHRWVYQMMAAPSLLSLPLALAYLTYRTMAWRPGRTLALQPGARRVVRPARVEARARGQLYLSLSAAVLAATALKDELKWIFGRPWPESWVKYGLYKFKPFTDDQLYGAFPSGHTAYIAAPLFLMCWLYPKQSGLWITLMAIVMFGLVAAGYHFVGDVLAGAFVGLAAAAGTVALVEAKGGK